MASNSGIKTLSQNKVLSNYFMYKFMKKNNRLLPDWKDSGGLQQVSRMMKCVLFFMLTLVCGVQGKVLLSDADRRTTTNRPAGFFTSHNPSQCVFKIKTGDGIGCAAGIKPAIRPTADV